MLYIMETVVITENELHIMGELSRTLINIRLCFTSLIMSLGGEIC